MTPGGKRQLTRRVAAVLTILRQLTPVELVAVRAAIKHADDASVGGERRSVEPPEVHND